MPFQKGQPKPANSGRKRGTPTDPLKIEYWELSRVRPYERNPRKNDKAVDRMRASIREYGFAVPILARSDGEVVDGHLRLKAAIAEKMAMVPVIVCDRWTAAQVKAFRLMANRSVDWAEWDLEALALEFGELKALEFDLSLTGFDKNEIGRIAIFRNEAEDEVPPVPESPKSRIGDVYVLGDHRVLCGDSTNAEHVARLLCGVKPALMVTDPPYGVEYDPEWRNKAAADGKIGQQKASRAVGRPLNDNRADWTEAWKLFAGSTAYVWHAGQFASSVHASLIAAGFEIRSQIIWAKNNFAIGRGNYHYQHEPCWYAARSAVGWAGDRSQTTLWKIDKPLKSETGHSTQKPVECMRRPMVNHSAREVYDPFLGSGTTVIAAESTGRRCFGLELEPAYVDVIVERWEKFTGKSAVLESRL